MTAYQRTLEGGIVVAGLTPLQRQLVAIMEDEPETQDDEDQLALRWFQRHTNLVNELPGTLYSVIATIRNLNFRERRRELAKSGLYPYSPEEQARRQKRGKGGPPG